MGITYKAFDTSLHVPVALKVINATYLQDDTARQRFLREARTAAQLRHPNVATVYHLGQAGDDAYFYAMELIEGETFDELVKREGQLEPCFALELTLQAARALAAAHERGLIHRDIKPANLMLYRQHGEPVVKVIDFGLAKAIRPDEGKGLADAGSDFGRLTRTDLGGFVGTPQYASPEQLEGLEVDTRSDIYSLGITLWFMLAGRPPFEGTTLARIVTQHLCRQPPFEQLAGVPAPLCALLRRMLEKDPSLRPQQPLALRDEIVVCLRQLADPGAYPNQANPALARENFPDAVVSPEGQGKASVPILPDLGSGAETEENAATQLGAPTSWSLPADELAPGVTVGGHYRLGEALDTGVFEAEDTTNGQPITIRLLPPDLSAATRRHTASVAARLRAVEHPNVLRLLDFSLASAGTSPNAGCFVLEWIDGDTLQDFLTHRGTLTLPESLALLAPAAEGIEALAATGITSPDLRPAYIFLPEDENSSDDAAMGLKLGPTELFPSPTLLRGDQTVVDSGADIATSGSPTRRLGWLTYELLGGSPHQADTGRYAPLPALDEAGNALLSRYCLGTDLDDDDTTRSRTGAREFVAALRRCAAGAKPATDRAPQQVSARVSAPAVPAEASWKRVASIKPRRAWAIGRFLLFLLLLDGGAFGAWYGWKSHQPEPRVAGSLPSIATPVGPAAATVSAPPAAVPTPFRVDAPWENSLGMKFLPVGSNGFFAAVWPTRVQDFAAFVAATRYDATGGMVSLGADGRRRQGASRSWQDPGFPQTPPHPAVGVNFDDANAFCAWLTKREHDAGLLPLTHRYRLPTDTEWSQLAGLREEPASAGELLPEIRDLHGAEIFPWGDQWPPPLAPAGNYAGAEFAEPAPVDRLREINDGFPHTAPVGSFPANALGLFDVGGNVWQWCSDRFKAGADWHTVRGASWLCGSRTLLRLSARQGYAPAFRHDDIGFRCVLAREP